MHSNAFTADVEKVISFKKNKITSIRSAVVAEHSWAEGAIIYMVTYEIVGVVNFIKLSTFSLPIRIIFVKSIRVYASQNGQKKGRSLKITKHILSRFLFRKKLI